MHDETQSPYKSGTTVKGFYIGKTHQEASSYEISTEYTYENKSTVASVTLSVNGGQSSKNDYTIKRFTEGTFIDSNQLFMYTRSFDKTSTSFADNPSVAVYNPMSQKMQTANFLFTASAKAVLTNETSLLYAKVPTLGVLVDGTPFMMQIAAPNMITDKSRSDCTQFGSQWYAKHTPLRFRVGYMSFELNYQVGAPQVMPQQGQQLWTALNDYASKKD